MIRRMLLSSMLGLLASCAQPVVDPVPAAPATLSSDLADAASDVATDAQGNAYVLGYRNQDVNRDVNSGGANLPAELFVGQFSKAGVLNWLTVLRTDPLDEAFHTLSLVTTNAAVYTLTQSEYLGPLFLHKLEFGGALLWSKVIVERAGAVSSFYASPGGRLFVQYSVASDEDSFIRSVSAIDAKGNVEWSKTLPGELLGVGGDSGLYFADALKLQKYNAAGAPLWSQNITPDAPYTDSPYTGPFVSLITEGAEVYALVNFYLERTDANQGSLGNTQINRFTPAGEEVWSKFLYPVEEGSLASNFSASPVGVGSDGDLYLLVESEHFDASGVEETSIQQLHHFFTDGGHTSAALETVSRDVQAASLVPGRVTDSFGLLQTVFYTVSTSGKNLTNCINLIDQDRPCAYTDVFTSLYTIDSASDKTSLYTHLQWSFR